MDSASSLNLMKGSEKWGGRRSKTGKKSRLCGVGESLPRKGKWRDTSVQVVIFLCTLEFRS